LDQVWTFLRAQPGLRTDGHNLFLYHHPARRGDPMNVDFGVEVTRSFSPSGEVYETSTPAGEAAIAVHRGGYDQLHGAHDAIHQWAKSHDRIFAGRSWEIYGDWSDDPSKLETTVVYLLA
jgi:effector-binding domain-containing protein